MILKKNLMRNWHIQPYRIRAWNTGWNIVYLDAKLVIVLSFVLVNLNYRHRISLLPHSVMTAHVEAWQLSNPGYLVLISTDKISSRKIVLLWTYFVWRPVIGEKKQSTALIRTQSTTLKYEIIKSKISFPIILRILHN